ncbi:MAG: hypothetical protein QT02_C0002G0053 [archaeon GW2011_AR9]|nr:MAG: hypothetical protein QT02_C0002G0053 [archaeon GW2011_AR9]MBS3120596.1 hypothetical protein [Candidatus Woesearchaeota archaeon]HIG93010.1 hypothetical protein [Candidatus Woesearchaeota archaeon]HIH12494.1 hypothetical protein [Candidatus Woesearchaeota archaeon]
MPLQPNSNSVVVYHVVPRLFEAKNLFPSTGALPNAARIAAHYGCRLEFREAELIPSPHINHWSHRPSKCISAVLVGEDKHQLAAAKGDIHKFYGVFKNYGSIVRTSDRIPLPVYYR